MIRQFIDIGLLGFWVFLASHFLYSWIKEKYRSARKDFVLFAPIVLFEIGDIVRHNFLHRPWSFVLSTTHVIVLIVLLGIFLWSHQKNQTWLELSNYELLFEYRRLAKSVWRMEGWKPGPEAETPYETAALIYFILRNRDPSERLFLPLLRHRDERVSVFAAWNLLWTKTEESLKVLGELAKRTDALGKWARMLSEQWRTGELKPMTEEPPREWWEQNKSNGLFTRLLVRAASFWNSF